VGELQAEVISAEPSAECTNTVATWELQRNATPS
jgi:hypothetical protein